MVKWIEGDLTQSNFETALPDKIDAVVHLAQARNYHNFPERADEIAAVNVNATLRLLDYARRAGTKVFVFASSGSVYEPFDTAMNEETTLHPQSFYAASKVAAEVLTAPYADYFRVANLRLFFPFGPGQKGRLFSNIIESILADRPVYLHGTEDGMTLSSIYVDDIVNMISAALTETAWTGPINIASPEVVSLRGLAMTIAAASGKTPEFQIADGAAVRVVPDLSKLKAIYPGPFTSIEDGIKRTLAEL